MKPLLLLVLPALRNDHTAGAHGQPSWRPVALDYTRCDGRTKNQEPRTKNQEPRTERETREQTN
ncbi:MAG TPA: hypothetical protein VGD58_00825 [Herpetosiphonaceae bacterium]